MSFSLLDRVDMAQSGKSSNKGERKKERKKKDVRFDRFFLCIPIQTYHSRAKDMRSGGVVAIKKLHNVLGVSW
jgi:hypothetical protein